MSNFDKALAGFSAIALVFLVLILFIATNAVSRDPAKSISAACDNTGQFTASGVTYRCAAITQETLNESYKRQFEHCRKWLHNPWRDREMPLVRNDNE